MKNDTTTISAITSFSALLLRHEPKFVAVAETAADGDFLSELFVACSPLRDTLPLPVVVQQAKIREVAYRADYPAAMRRIILVEGLPAGRVLIDWAVDDAAMLIDIAVKPDRQGAGIGTALLRAFLDVADHRRQPALLQVAPGNPAIRLYERLGFVCAEAAEITPYIDMVRAATGP